MMRLLAAALFLFVSASPAAGQNTTEVPRTVIDRAARGQWHVRATTVVAADTTMVEGRLRREREGIRIGTEIVAPATITQLERRTESSGGMLIGGVIGAFVGGAMGDGMQGLGEGNDDGYMAVAMLSGLGAVIGILAGRAAKKGTVRWEPIWVQPATGLRPPPD
jgi:hypothetical protein